MKPRFRRGVVTDLVVLIVATLLPLMLLSGYLARRNIDATRANASQNAIWQARETAARADALIGETQALLIGLSQTATIREGNPDQVRALLREVKTRYPYYDDLLALDGRGLVYVSAASLYGVAVGGTGPLHPREVPGAGQIATSEIQISRATGHPVVLVGVPVYASAGNHAVVGEVAAALDLLLLQQWLDNRALSPGTTITVVDNPGARVLARSDDPAAWVGRVVGDIPLVRTAIELDEGVVEGASFGDTTRHSAFTTARSVPWTVIVGIPNEAMDAPVRQELRLMALRIALTTLAVVALAVVGSRRIIGPLRRLTGGMLMIARGDLDHRLAVERRDEVGQVAGAVNQMADELIGSIAALQQAQGRLEGAVSQVGRALTSTADTPDLFARLVEAARALTRSDAAALVVASGGQPVVDGRPAPPPKLLALLEESYGIAVGPNDRLPLAPLAIESLRSVGLREHLIAVVRARGEVLGTLHVFRQRPDAFGAEDGRLLGAFADQAAIAIEQDRLRKEAAEAAALRRLQELQSQFLTTAAHELRAPVTGIKSYAELLLRDDLDLAPATRRECLAGIDRLSDRLAAQVRIFFDAMRADAGQLALRLEAVDLARLAEEVVRDFAARSPAHQIRLETSPDLPPVHADRGRAEDVLTNLLDNAIKYSPAGGPIRVELTTIPAGVTGGDSAVGVAIHDAGIGIAAEEQPRVFERFSRLDHSTTRQAGGIGLGLFLCRAYVEAMGGTIGVESQPGVGSTFRFTIPVAAANPVPELETTLVV